MPRRKGWLTLLLEQRLRDGLPIAANSVRYIQNARYVKNGQHSFLAPNQERLRQWFHFRLEKFAKKHSLVRVLGPRGGLWTAVWVADPTAHGLDIELRHLGMTYGVGYYITDPEDFPARRGWQMWRIRRYQGQPYLCLKPRERRWYDPPWGYLVA